jgi:hypothetical protein
MIPPEDPGDELTPAERRLNEHLDILRQDVPRPAVQIVPRVIRSARWQRVIRRPLVAIGALAASIGTGLRLLIKPPPGRS